MTFINILPSLTPNLNIVLVQPEIPNNTGSIGRTCVGTASRLHHLVGKLASLILTTKPFVGPARDYWEHLDLKRHQSQRRVSLKMLATAPRIFYFSKKALNSFYDIQFRRGDWLVFGKETTGLDKSLLRQVESQTVRIPMWGPIRSLNLSNAVSIVIYEAMRQLDESRKDTHITLS